MKLYLFSADRDRRETPISFSKSFFKLFKQFRISTWPFWSKKSKDHPTGVIVQITHVSAEI